MARLVVAVLLAGASAAHAKDIIVGGAVGWGLGATTAAATAQFLARHLTHARTTGMQYPTIQAEVGDVLVFNYLRMHDVRRLCVASRPVVLSG